MKIITTIVLILGFSFISFGQINRDKIKTLKIAYITEKLSLNEKEAQQFWPIYNSFEDDMMQLRKQAYETRKKVDINTISEEDAVIILKEIRTSENKKHQLENDFTDKLSKVISAKKIILLHKIEDDFKRKIFEEYKRRGRQ